MIRAAGRLAGILAVAMSLSGCGTMIEQHLRASRELAAACEELSKNAPEAPLSAEEYLDSLQARVWPAVDHDQCLGAPQMFDPAKPQPPMTSVPLLLCALNAKLYDDLYRSNEQEWQTQIRPALTELRAAVIEAAGAWKQARRAMDAQRAEITKELVLARQQNRRAAFAKMFLQGEHNVRPDWDNFQGKLVILLGRADALDKAVRAASLDATWRSFQLDLLAYTQNLRISVGKVRQIAFDEAQIARDQLTGRISQTFAVHYLRAVDRSLVPLERGFDRLDEKSYGLGTLGLEGVSSSIDKALFDTYSATEATLCPKCDPKDHSGQADVVVREFVRAVGRAACKRLDEPADNVASPMLMQYVYRFHARIAAATYDKDAQAVAVRSTKVEAAAAPEVRQAQLLQYALAEWNVRDALLAQDLSTQLRGGGSAATNGTTTFPSFVVAGRPDEAGVEKQARQQAAAQVVQSWAQAQGDRQGVALQLSVVNNIAVSQQVSVQVVNQQSVVNQIRVDASSPAPVDPGRARGLIRFEPAVIQVNAPSQRPFVPVCAGAALGRCAELTDGFAWRIAGFSPGSDRLPKTALHDIIDVQAQIARLLAARPGVPFAIEVHGYASKEALSCAGLRARRGQLPAGDDAPPCDGKSNANPFLSYERAKNVRNELKARIAAPERLLFAPLIAHGDTLPEVGRVVEIRVFATQ